MQTFLPYRDFKKTARSLDRQRLGKQRVETYQLLRALNGETKGWVNHPAARMWSGHEKTLVVYGTTICAEWKNRGYVDNMQARIGEYFYKFPDSEERPPPWLGDQEFHLSHQSNLVRKFPEHYGPLFPGVPDDLEYIWPVIDLDADIDKTAPALKI